MLPPPLAPILIAGPTASGKSALAAALAARLNGVVINCDAMQVYRRLPILTAQPDAAAKAQAPHWLYEITDPAQPFSAGLWLTAAQEALHKAAAQNLRPILTGGTGMYFQILLKGLADIPPVPPEIRRQLQADWQAQGEPAIRMRLARHDPEAAQIIARGDQLRLLRALEIILATGKTQRHWQDNTSGGLLATARPVPLILLPPRDALYAACNNRFIQMAAQGAIAEVEALRPDNLAATLPAMKIIGLREIAAFLAGAVSWESAEAAARQATRNYAKRQMTWFRNQWQSNKTGFAQPPILHNDFYRDGALPALCAAIGAYQGR